MGNLRLRIRGNEGASPLLLDVTAFLYDFNLLYEVSRLALDPDYDNYSFSQRWYYRDGRPLDDNARLQVVSLRHESPIELVTIIQLTSGAVSAIAATMSALAAVAQRKRHRQRAVEQRSAEVQLELLQAQLAKLQHELRQLGAPSEARIEAALERRRALPAYEAVTNRLESSEIELTDADIEIIGDIPPDENEVQRRLPKARRGR